MGRIASRAFNTSCSAAALAKTNACQQAARQALSAATAWSRGNPDMPASTVKKIATPASCADQAAVSSMGPRKAQYRLRLRSMPPSTRWHRKAPRRDDEPYHQPGSLRYLGERARALAPARFGLLLGRPDL